MQGFFKFNPFKSVTVGGLVVLVANHLVTSIDPAALTPKGVAAVNLVGVVLTVLGLRNAAAKGPEA